MLFLPAADFFSLRSCCGVHNHQYCQSRLRQRLNVDEFMKEADAFMEAPLFERLSGWPVPVLNGCRSRCRISLSNRKNEKEDAEECRAIRKENTEVRERVTDKVVETERGSRHQGFLTVSDLVQSIMGDSFHRRDHDCRNQERIQSSSKLSDTVEVKESVNSRRRFGTGGDWVQRILESADQDFGTFAKNEVTEECKDFRVEIKTGDFKPEEIQVKVANGYLTVSAKREEKNEEKGTVKSERMERMMSLPSCVNRDDVRAQMSEGTLTLMAPKTTHSGQPKERILKIQLPLFEGETKSNDKGLEDVTTQTNRIEEDVISID